MTWKNTLVTKRTGVPAKSSRPVTTITAKPSRIHGSSRAITTPTGVSRSAAPSRRASIAAVSPRKSAIVSTWIDSTIG